MIKNQNKIKRKSLKSHSFKLYHKCKQEYKISFYYEIIELMKKYLSLEIINQRFGKISQE